MKTKYIIIFLFSCFYAHSQSLEEKLFKEANQYFQQQDFPKAIDAYQQILDSNFVSFELYFNLANSYFQYGKIAQSIYFYEKALIEKPRHKQCLNNLNLALNRIEIIEPIPTLFYNRWWKSLTLRLPLNTWAILVVIGVWKSILLIVLFMKKRKKWIFNTTLVSVTILLMLSSLLYHSFQQNKQHYGIIMNATQLYEKVDSTRSFFTVKAGNKAIIKDSRYDKLLILLADGQSGWIDKDEIKKIK
jgi:tetratricopeptide (TPR) repeat protein